MEKSDLKNWDKETANAAASAPPLAGFGDEGFQNQFEEPASVPGVSSTLHEIGFNSEVYGNAVPQVPLRANPIPTVRAEPPPPSYTECTVDCPSSEEEVREALHHYVQGECCAGGRAAKDMKIHEIQPVHAFRYVLDTFSETRTVEVKSEPYVNQQIDGAQNGPTPDKWNVPLRPTQKFANSTMEIPLPHSASVMECGKCHQTGYTSCDSCNGVGFKRCTWCRGTGKTERTINTPLPVVTVDSSPHHHHGHGHHHHHAQLQEPHHHGLGHHAQPHCGPHHHHSTVIAQSQIIENCSSCCGMGRKNCSHCDLGRVRCKTCGGHKFVKNWQVLKIKWTNKTDTYETGREQLNQKFLKHAGRGGVMFDERCPGNSPKAIACTFDTAIVQAAQRIMSRQLMQVNHIATKILEFRQRIEIIPVVKVIFEHKGKHGHFFIYGIERVVHFPEGYPGNCCCCTIM